AAGYRISIKRSIQVLVPTNNYNRDMNVYKGEEENGKINWKDPSPLPKDPTTEKIDEGEKLYKTYCPGCDKIYEDFTGPALYGVTDRRPKKWLYDYTRHVTEMSSYGNEDSIKNKFTGDAYAICLFKKYGHQIMT